VRGRAAGSRRLDGRCSSLAVLHRHARRPRVDRSILAAGVAPAGAGVIGQRWLNGNSGYVD
jgi:hypothetical protein